MSSSSSASGAGPSRVGLSADDSSTARRRPRSSSGDGGRDADRPPAKVGRDAGDLISHAALAGDRSSAAGGGGSSSSSSSTGGGATGGEGSSGGRPRPAFLDVSTFRTWGQRSEEGFVGLANQGATCYMNSLLQTLFMTPEFRAVLFRWKFDEKLDPKAEECIPLQLQRLFGLLQLSHQRAIGTHALTRSFGWTSADSFQQHDVQELCHVLLEALEQSLSEHSEEERLAFSRLFEGRMRDFVECTECHSERHSEDKFSTLGLDIRPLTGDNRVLGSVEESLAFFSTPEVMDGENKVDCDHCARKTASRKGLALTNPPNNLLLSLKRFTYDFVSGRRVKLHDRVAYPFFLDLNPFIRATQGAAKPLSAEATTLETAPATATGGDAVEMKTGATVKDDHRARDDGVAGQPAASDANGGAGSTSAPSDTKPPAARTLTAEERARARELSDPCYLPWTDPRELLRTRGPHVYELYSVMVHQGGAQGGHYYAYIKDLGRGRWFQFNDSSVSPASPEAVIGPYGGNMAVASAYLLAYRRVDLPTAVLIHPPRRVDVAEPESVPERDPESAEGGGAATSVDDAPAATPATASPPGDGAADAPTEEPVLPPANAFQLVVPSGYVRSGVYNTLNLEVPEYVRAEVARMDEEEAKRAAEEEKRLRTIYITVYYNGRPETVTVDREDTVADLVRAAWIKFRLNGTEPGGAPSLSTSAPAPAPIPLDCCRLRGYSPVSKKPREVFVETQSLREARLLSVVDVLLETKLPTEDWPVVDLTRIAVQVFVFRPEEERIDGPFEIRPRKVNPLRTLRKLIAEHPSIGIAPPFQRILRTSGRVGDLIRSAMTSFTTTSNLSASVFSGDDFALQTFGIFDGAELVVEAIDPERAHTFEKRAIEAFARGEDGAAATGTHPVLGTLPESGEGGAAEDDDFNPFDSTVSSTAADHPDATGGADGARRTAGTSGGLRMPSGTRRGAADDSDRPPNALEAQGSVLRPRKSGGAAPSTAASPWAHVQLARDGPLDTVPDVERGIAFPLPARAKEEGALPLFEEFSSLAMFLRVLRLRITVPFTALGSKEPAGSVTIDKTLTVGHLRARIAKELGLDLSAFFLSRRSPEKFNWLSDDRAVLSSAIYGEAPLLLVLPAAMRALEITKIGFFVFFSNQRTGTAWLPLNINDIEPAPLINGLRTPQSARTMDINGAFEGNTDPTALLDRIRAEVEKQTQDLAAKAAADSATDRPAASAEPASSTLGSSAFRALAPPPASSSSRHPALMSAPLFARPSKPATPAWDLGRTKTATELDPVPEVRTLDGFVMQPLSLPDGLRTVFKRGDLDAAAAAFERVGLPVPPRANSEVPTTPTVTLEEAAFWSTTIGPPLEMDAHTWRGEHGLMRLFELTVSTETMGWEIRRAVHQLLSSMGWIDETLPVHRIRLVQSISGPERLFFDDLPLVDQLPTANSLYPGLALGCIILDEDEGFDIGAPGVSFIEYKAAAAAAAAAAAPAPAAATTAADAAATAATATATSATAAAASDSRSSATGSGSATSAEAPVRRVARFSRPTQTTEVRIVTIRWYDASRGVLGPRRELAILKSDTYRSVGERVSKATGIPLEELGYIVPQSREVPSMDSFTLQPFLSKIAAATSPIMIYADTYIVLTWSRGFARPFVHLAPRGALTAAFQRLAPFTDHTSRGLWFIPQAEMVRRVRTYITAQGGVEALRQAFVDRNERAIAEHERALRDASDAAATAEEAEFRAADASVAAHAPSRVLNWTISATVSLPTINAKERDPFPSLMDGFRTCLQEAVRSALFGTEASAGTAGASSSSSSSSGTSGRPAIRAPGKGDRDDDDDEDYTRYGGSRKTGSSSSFPSSSYSSTSYRPAERGVTIKVARRAKPVDPSAPAPVSESGAGTGAGASAAETAASSAADTDAHGDSDSEDAKSDGAVAGNPEGDEPATGSGIGSAAHPGSESEDADYLLALALQASLDGGEDGPPPTRSGPAASGAIGAIDRDAVREARYRREMDEQFRDSQEQALAEHGFAETASGDASLFPGLEDDEDDEDDVHYERVKQTMDEGDEEPER